MSISKYVFLSTLFFSGAGWAITAVEPGPVEETYSCAADETLLVGYGHSASRCRAGGAAEAESLAMDDLQNNAYCTFVGNCDGTPSLRTDLPSGGNWHYGIIGCDAQQYGCAKCVKKGGGPGKLPVEADVESAW